MNNGNERVVAAGSETTIKLPPGTAEGAATVDGREGTNRLFGGPTDNTDRITVYDATPGSTTASGSHRIPRRGGQVKY